MYALSIFLKKDFQINSDLANNGYEAIEMVKKRKENYDLILMDIEMPGIDGYCTAKQVLNCKNNDLLDLIDK